MVSWNYSFSASVGYNFLGKTTKAKYIGQKKPRNGHDCWQKPKAKNYIGENPQTAQDSKTEKPQFLGAKTEKPDQKLAKSANRKS